MSNIPNNLETTRDMKDSRIEWIGEIPKEWELTKASLLFKAEKGKNAQTYTKEYIGANPGVYPVYSGQTENDGIMGTINTFVYDKEVIFSTTVGAKAMTPKLISGKFSLSQNCMIANLRQDAYIRFFYYQCIPLFSHYKNLISQYMQPSFTVEEFLSYRFIIPPLSEQQAIANYLDEKVGKIDELIADQNQAIENWKAYKQSLITEKVTKGLNPSVEMKDSGIEWIGEIPVSWEVFKLKNKYKFHTGFTPDSKNEDYYDDCGYLWITISDLTDSKYISNSSKKISQVGLNNSKGILTPKKSLLYSFKLSVGQVAIADKDCYTNEAIASFPVKENPCIEFLYYSSQICIVKNANENIYGAKILNQDLINNAWIIFPPLNEQQAIANYLDETVEKIDELIKQKQIFIKQLEEYKQSLIYECVTGKRYVL